MNDATARIDYTDLRAGLRERVERLARNLLGEPMFRGRREWRWGKKGSLALVVSGERRGCWRCFASDMGGETIELIEFARSCSFADAVVWGAGWIGGAAVDHTLRQHMERLRESPADNTGRAQAIWREARDPRGTIVEAYLRSRGLTLPDEPVLRFHPRCPFGHGQTLSAMIARMTDPVSGQPLGIHRTAIRPDGSGKADIDRPKRMLGDSGVIRLYELETAGLGLAEGIETALAVAQRFGWGPVWAATSASGVRTFPVLPATTLNIFADNDPAGLTAARSCAGRWVEAGAEVLIRIPLADDDWDDAARRLVT